jgi:hypothetical protein
MNEEGIIQLTSDHFTTHKSRQWSTMVVKIQITSDEEFPRR